MKVKIATITTEEIECGSNSYCGECGMLSGRGNEESCLRFGGIPRKEWNAPGRIRLVACRQAQDTRVMLDNIPNLRKVRDLVLEYRDAKTVGEQVCTLGAMFEAANEAVESVEVVP